VHLIRREDFFSALTALGNPNTNPFQGRVDLPISRIGTLWVELWLNPGQMSALTGAGIAVAAA